MVLKFRSYLYGRPFQVVSDHHSLCWLTSLRNPSGRLARWSLRLQEFDITVVYKSGRQHSDADCLSRAPVTPADDEEYDIPFLGAVNTTTMSQKQREDPELRPLIDFLEGQTSSVPKAFTRGLSSFSLRNNVLFKRNFTPNGNAHLLVVPATLRNEILQACHDEPTAGHLGFTRTLARIQEKYYWPRLSLTVKHYVRTCRDCQRRKPPPGRPAGLLQPVQIPEKLFEQVGTGLLAPYPLSSSGNKFVIVATDCRNCYDKTRP